MAKEIKFNVKLVVDGKEQLVTATSTAEELRRVLDSAKTSSQKLNAALVNFNQAVSLITLPMPFRRFREHSTALPRKAAVSAQP